MAGMGPAPKPAEQRRRRNATVAMTSLPSQGRPEPAPAWPLIPDVVLNTRHQLSAAKVEQLQHDRQALMAVGQAVGAIERRIDAAMEREAIMAAQLRAQRDLEASLWADLWRLPQAVEWERLGWTRDVAQYVRHKVMAELGELDAAKEARQWSDRLGLSPMAMLRLRWQVVHDEVAEKRAEKTAGDVRTRLRAVEGG